MKNKFQIFILLALAAVVGTALAQVSMQKQETTAQQVREGRTDAEPLISTLARGLVDRTDSLVVSAWEGGLLYEGTRNAYQTRQTFTDPTQDNAVTVPDAGGTITYNSVTANAATGTLDQGVLYGGTHTNTGAAGATVLTLPAPVVGMEFTVFLTVAQDVDINPADGTTILVLTNAAGDAISSAATIGNRITLRAISTTEWIPLETSGTWSDAN